MAACVLPRNRARGLVLMQYLGQGLSGIRGTHWCNMGEEKSVRVDPHQLLKALSPLLGSNGEVKGAAEMDRVMSLMKDAKKLVSKSIYMNILKATDASEVLERCMGRGGWDLLYTWLKEAKEDENVPFLAEMLRVYQKIPVTLALLKQNSTAKSIKSLMKSSDNEDVKTLAKDIVDKWMKLANQADSNSEKKSKHRDKERSDKERHRSHHHHRSSSSSSKDSSHSQNKDSKENNTDNSPHKDDKSSTSSKKDRHSSTESNSSKSSHKSKDGPRTAKTPPSLYRSTGLEQETVLPPAKKKSTIGVVDKEKLAAIKRTSASKGVGEPPEKKAKPTPPKPTAPTPNPASKIKIIPARPKPTVQVYDSSDFMDALSASSANNAAPRRKRKASNTPPASSPTSKHPAAPPTSPTAKTPAAKNSAAAAPSENGNTSPQQQQQNDDDKPESVVPSFYKETMGDEEKSEETKEDSNDTTESMDTSAPAPTNGKKKKRVQWVPDDKLVSTFYFEMNEDERVNVNKIRAFEEIRRQESMMERQAMQKAPGAGPGGMHGGPGGLWRRPAPISELPACVVAGVNSTERDTQARREQAVLQALYFTKEMIPDSATEPDADPAPPGGEYDEPKVIPLHDETGGGETFVDHSKTPMPKPGGMQPLQPTPPMLPMMPPTEPQFSLPPEIANMLGNMAQELTTGRPLPPPHNGPAPFPDNVQQILNSILEQNPAAAQNEAMKAQLQMMMESGPIREQIQAWANGHGTAPPLPGPAAGAPWQPPHAPPPPGMPGGGLLPHPNMPPADFMHMHGPPRGAANHRFPPGGWGPRGGPRGGLMGGGPRGFRGGGGPGGRGGPGRGGRRDRQAPPPHTVLCNKFPECPYGDDCRFKHPGKNTRPQSQTSP